MTWDKHEGYGDGEPAECGETARRPPCCLKVPGLETAKGTQLLKVTCPRGYSRLPAASAFLHFCVVSLLTSEATAYIKSPDIFSTTFLANTVASL